MAIDDNASYELTGYQVKDLAQKIRAKADSNSLASVATSGLYSDLTGAPTIPTVYNGTLTIQQNGTQLGTFSANQSSNTTINITGGGGSSITNFYVAGNVYDDVQQKEVGIYTIPLDDSDDYTIYSDSAMTTPVSGEDFNQAFADGLVKLNARCEAYGAWEEFIVTSCAADIDEYPDYRWYRIIGDIEGFGGPDDPVDTFIFKSSDGSSSYDFIRCKIQNQIIAGSNISIAADGRTISAANTTYSAFTGATSGAAGTSGLVPQPAAGDNTKFLAGDGTWKTAGGGGATTFYVNHMLDDTGGINLYKDSAMTTSATVGEIYNAAKSGAVKIVVPDQYGGLIVKEYDSVGTVYDSDDDFYATAFVDTGGLAEKYLVSGSTNATSIPAGSDHIIPFQEKLTAGTGISISSQNVISATGGGINHLFYLTQSFESYNGVAYNVPVYKDRACTQSATYAEIYDAIKNGGASFCLESGSDQSILWQDVWETDGSQFCNDSDEGDNTIWVTRSGSMTKLTPEDTGSGDNYPNNSAYFTAEFLGTFAVDPRTTYMKSNDNGTYSFYKKFSNDNNAYSFTELIYCLGYQHSVSDRVQSFVKRRAVQSSVHPNPYYGGFIVAYVYDNNHNGKELRATFIKKVNGVETFVLCDITAQSDLDTEFTVTEIPFDQAMTGATSSVAGAAGIVPAPAAGDQNKALKGDGTWGDVSEEFVIMKYGEANAWAKFIDAYNKNKIVYCRASSNANPGTGSQTRLAFMAYVSNETSPTNVEFQYVRSVGTKTSSQPVDQVFVYKLESTNGGTWSFQTRDMAPKIAAGTGINVSYSNGTYTISLA